MAKNYYAILGITPSASEAEIKAAYRRKAKQLHPDTCGQDCEPFLSLQQAYEVLSDRARRRAYDIQLAGERQSRAPRSHSARAGVRDLRTRAESLRPAEPRVPAEPLRPPEPLRPAERRVPPEPIFPREPVFPREDWFLQEWSQELPRRSLFEEVLPLTWVDWEDRVEQVYAEVHLAPGQARRGGQVEIRIPVQVTCPACRGWGGRGQYVCARCAGRGRVATERPLVLSLPGDIVEGDEARIALDRIGVPGVTLTIRFVVDW